MAKANNVVTSLNDTFEIDSGVEDLSTSNIPVVVEATPVQFVDVIPERDKAEEDFEFARTNLRDIAEKGKDVLNDIIAVAKSSEHPRAFEVAAQMMKNLSDVNKDIMNLRQTHKTTKQLGSAPGTRIADGGTNIENAVFVGSPSELLKLKRKERNETTSPRPPGESPPN
jgi:hypothetical protein